MDNLPSSKLVVGSVRATENTYGIRYSIKLYIDFTDSSARTSNYL